MLLGLFQAITWHQFDLLTSFLSVLKHLDSHKTNFTENHSNRSCTDTAAFPHHFHTTLKQMSQIACSWVEGREWFLTSPPCMRACECFPLRLVESVFHTHTTLEAGMNADDTVSDVENELFCSTTVCRCWTFAFLPQEQHRSF